jgi:uncharacterized protein (TIGR03437 family)
MSFFLRIAALCALATTLTAQPDRISGRIDPSRTVTLKSRLHPEARVENDRGPVDPSLEISYATLHLKPTPAQQAALEKLLVEQQDSASPYYHRWLTPDEYGDRFGLGRADIAKITGWLASQGLKVHDVAHGRHWITFSGTAANVGRGFRTEFRHYVTDGERHFANSTVPSIPEALAEMVAGVEGLDDYYPAAPPTLRPYYNNSAGAHFLAPDDVATIYNLKPLLDMGFDGTGQTIAIIGNTAMDLGDVRSFRSRFNLPPNDPKPMLVGPDPGTVSAGVGEANLDMQWAGAVARNATLIFVYARSTSTAVQYAVDQRVAPVITESFGTCEQATTPFQRPIAQQANAEGITWMASTGDVGGAGCERQSRMTVASKGLAVQTPASIPEVTAVGGAEFDEGAGSYWNSANDTNGASARSYIPEMVWNDTSANGYLSAATGGASIFYAKPWWQTGPGVPNDSARDVPDIALSASWSHDAYFMYNNGVAVSNGGTSAAAPSFAGFVAILNQYLMSKGAISQPGLGNINPTLYRLAQSAPSAFHDIVNGDNIVPCMPGTPNCTTGSIGYTAGPGYDLATGLGSIDAYNLATNWTSGTPTSTTVTATPATLAFNSGSVKLTAAVSATGGVPSGDVTFLMNDTALGTATLSGATATLTLSAIQFPVGTNTVTAVFNGANGMNISAGVATVTVTAPASASAVVASVSPNPVNRSLFGSWSFVMTLTNESAVSATLTKLSIGGTDYTSSIVSWFGASAIPANKSVSSGSLSFSNLNAPIDQVFAFSGTDSNGAAWSQQVTVPFTARTQDTWSFRFSSVTSVPADPSADPSCRWSQPLVFEELGGYDTQLSAFSVGNTDLTSLLPQIFGTTTVAPYGRLQGTLCWDSSNAGGSKSVKITAWPSEQNNSDLSSVTISTTLASGPNTITSSASPAVVNFTGSASQKVSLSFTGGSPAWSARISPVDYLTNWLTVSPASGTGAAQLTVTTSSTGLGNGVYTATVLIQASTASPQIVSVPVVLVVGGSSDVSIGGAANAASYKTVFAPGMLMTVFGTNLAPAFQIASAVPFPLTMQGVSATVNGFPAPLYYVGPTQTTVQIPYETGAGPAILGVNNNGKVAYFQFQVQASAPGVFATLDGATNLVPFATGKRGDTLLAFITGEGAVNPPLLTSRTPTTTDVTQLPAPILPVTLTVGGVPAKLAFVGIPRGLVGVTQINFTIPANAPLGVQPVVVTVGGVASAPVNLTVTQ